MLGGFFMCLFFAFSKKSVCLWALAPQKGTSGSLQCSENNSLILSWPIQKQKANAQKLTP